MSTTTTDPRTTKELLTEWRKLDELRKSLVRQGLLDGDAPPAEVIATLRKVLPPDVFNASPTE
jgi:hypothetical protein